MGKEAKVLWARGVSKSFGGVQAVCNVNLDVAQGERHAIIGTNGAGKTTLFNLIAGDLRVTSGTIKIFGQDVTATPLHKRVKLGMRRTYQNPRGFPFLTVQQNIYLALLGTGTKREQLNVFRTASSDQERAARVVEIAKHVHLEDKLDSYVSDLSHGERKQLELGLVLVASPRLLLLDEPAAGLSAKERITMVNLLKQLQRDVTVLLIEHDMDIALGLADQVTVMHEGTVIAQGTPDEISNNALVQEIYLGGLVHV